MDIDTKSDQDLLRRAVGGDERALTAVIDRHVAAVTRYAWAITSRRMDVEEVVQDTFLTLWRRAGELASVESLLPWLLVTCRHHALNLNRKDARHRAEELDDELAAPDDPAEARDRLRFVMGEIDALSETDRRVCELCLVEGRPYAEAAEVVGLSVGAVKQRVLRTRTRLRKAVTDHER
ncbi:sigma-70 family RNA polymerase sigma factor [Frigoribacterium sp. ACAM 257]|uniref:RNA polymerase sigma factor n=1 Tax=Frigoribacterium sp. ACAM 257 TaxID=2508998 RepID=UPI0011B94D50|nr:sigma-70 family RNA polymerase sigma factor [Frigoribacterium sp. ACAM 257]TWX34573.1 sigma-70 family RNA polymerase sigma factor [Frigoribacterium sp. ACAM 257]